MRISEFQWAGLTMKTQLEVTMYVSSNFFYYFLLLFTKLLLIFFLPVTLIHKRHGQQSLHAHSKYVSNQKLVFARSRAQADSMFWAQAVTVLPTRAQSQMLDRAQPSSLWFSLKNAQIKPAWEGAWLPKSLRKQENPQERQRGSYRADAAYPHLLPVPASALQLAAFPTHRCNCGVGTQGITNVKQRGKKEKKKTPYPA